MELNEYQKKAMEFRLDTANEAYALLGIAGEVGELLSLVAKGIRDEVVIEDSKLVKELGDILWFVAAIAHDLKFDLNDIAQKNVEKLSKRKENGTIKGDGDDR